MGVKVERELKLFFQHNQQAQTIIKMLNQQISPWTIYDQNGKKVKQESKQKKLENKEFVHERLLAKPRSQQPNRFAKLNQVLGKIGEQKAKLNTKLDFLTSLRIIKNQLQDECNPISQICMQLPKIKNKQQKYQLQDVKSNKIKRKYYSQKINLIKQIDTANIQQFQHIFNSENLDRNPSIKFEKPQFPKIRKNNSVLLPQLDIKKQFDDNSIHQVLQSAKQIQFKKKIKMSTLLYEAPLN